MAETAEFRLLHLAGSGETNRQNHIQTWLYEIGITNVEASYQTSEGPADLYLPNRRCIIEVKRAKRLRDGPYKKGTGSKINESAYEQLARYILAERKRERLYFDDENIHNWPWLGVVTDGSKWWVWEWPPIEQGDSVQKNHTWNGTLLTGQNKKLLAELFNRKVGKEWAPINPSSIFESHFDHLMALYDKVKPYRSTIMQKRLWLEQLKAGGNVPKSDIDRMFVTHTLLILISRLVSGPGGATDGFVNWVPKSEVVAIRETVDEYNWRQRSGDVMRALYESFIPKEHRQVYGEYYTPDWLAEMLCLKVIDDSYITRQIELFRKGKPTRGILDPCCGSGTFLYHAARRVLDSNAMSDAYMGVAERTQFVCGLLYGMDIHPVAVEMSKANLYRLFPYAPSLHVYQGDSLLTPRSEARLYSDGGTNLVLFSPDGRQLVIPGQFLEDSIGMKTFVDSAAKDVDLPPGIGSGLNKAEMKQLRDGHEQLREIIRNESNGIWYWYIRNQGAPLLLMNRKMGRILSNPPWVAMRKIQVESRKKEIIEMAMNRDLWVGGRNATTFNIAALFVDRCMGLYLDGGRSCWVLPDSAMKSGTWSKYHDKMSDRNPALWDLDNLPFPKQSKSCVCVTGDEGGSGKVVKRLEKKEGVKGNIPSTISWHRVESITNWAEPKREFPKAASAWMDGSRPIARMGASITPNCLLMIDKLEPAEKGMVRLTTKRSIQQPWRGFGVMKNVLAPARWIHHIVLSANLMPFGIPNRTRVILPLEGTDFDASRDNNEYWKNASDVYDKYRGTGGSTPTTLDLQINHHGKLLKQLIEPYQNPVVYNNTGARLYAARMEPCTIIEHTLFAVGTTSKQEALFLTALLNADALQEAYVSTQESGRSHFAAHFWKKIPLPRYDASNRAHRRLSHLAKRAEKVAGDVEVCKRGAVLDTLREDGVVNQIDAVVKEMLPGYV